MIVKDRRALWYPAAILLLTVMVFLPSLRNGFTTLDDDVMVTGNALIRDLSPASVRRTFASPFNGLYHPLVLLSYAVEYRFFGLDARAYHATNLLLHLANVLLVFWLFHLISGDGRAAALTAALFAVHPLHVESVAWISERKDVLYALFFLGSAVAYLYWRERERARYYVLSLLLFLASLLSKPMAITLPAVLALMDAYRGRRLDGKAARALVPFVALSAVFGAVSVLVHYRPEDAAAVPAVSAWGGMVTACNAAVFYLAKLAVPLKLSCYYPYTGASWGAFYPFAAAGMLGAALTAAAAVLISRRFRAVGFGFALFIVMLLPVLQIVPVGQEVPADRYMYLPALGIFFAAAVLLVRAGERGKPAGYAALALALVVGGWFSYLSAKRCMVWKDGITLWSDVVAQFPEDPKAYKSRADAYKEARRYAPALEDYDRAIALKPDYASAYNNRGNLRSDMRDHAGAIADYSAAIGLKPSYLNARYNRGVAYMKTGDHDRALADYNALLERDPENARAYNNRGIIHAGRKQFSQAIRDFTAAITLQGGEREAYANRAAVYFFAGEHEKAAGDVAWLDRNGIPVNGSLRKALAGALADGRDRQKRRKMVK